MTAIALTCGQVSPEVFREVAESFLGVEHRLEFVRTLDGVDYYNYRVSWLVNGDHLSYLTNYLVSTDGLVVQEYLPETD